MDKEINNKEEMYSWAKDLFPINRSLTGAGTRATLEYLKKIIPELKIQSIASGTQVFDWTVPDEWNVKEAWIKNSKGEKIIDFEAHNLHLLGYSIPIHTKINLSELNEHLYSLPSQPNAIPYATSYYKKRWGFCLSENQRKQLKEDIYEVKIDSTLAPGVLNYGEVIIPGQEKSEILLSTYVCHPSMGNNELSGPVVTTALTRWIKQQPRKHTYRIVFLPETIGSISYLSRNIKAMKENTIAGFVLTCIGDNRSYSYLESRKKDTLADRAARQILKYHAPNYVTYTFLDRGSDERQYCSPGVDLPVCSLMRTKHGTYPEYHTSLDDLSVIPPDGLWGGYEMVKKCLFLLENNEHFSSQYLCEPQLGKRGLYPTLTMKDGDQEVRKMMNLLAYADGSLDLIELAEKLNINALDLVKISKKLMEHDLLVKNKGPYDYKT